MTSDRPTEPPRDGYRWARSDYGGGSWFQERVPTRRSVTPHTKLKSDARAAFTLWKQRTGISGYYLPYFVGSVALPGRRKASVGKRGAADSFIAVCGCVLAAEAKAGNDRASPDQIKFRDRWLKTGNPYVLYRSAAELVDALDRIASERGRGPFG